MGSCFTLHSNTTDRPLWTTLYSGCFRILVGSNGKISKRLRGGTFTKSSNRILKIGENRSAILHLLLVETLDVVHIKSPNSSVYMVNRLLYQHQLGCLSPICSKCRRLLTFDLQVDVILINSEAVPGHAGVFAAVVSLSRVHLQGAVVMNDVRVSIQGAGAALLKPESQRRLREPFPEIPPTRSSVRGSVQLTR